MDDLVNATPACIVCGASCFTPLWDVLQRCASCGFVTARLDAPLDPRHLYEGNYFTGEEYLDYGADQAFFQRNFRGRLEAIRRRQSGGRLLEIGAAYGFFLDLARNYFDGIGYEVNPAAVRHAQEELRLDVRRDDFLEADLDDVGGLFDVVVMWDVIEHLERPDLFLQKMAEFSKPGAWLYLTTGDIGSRVARRRGRKWRMIHPPSHLHYFDTQTIAKLLDRCGFDVHETRAIGVARSLRQVFYSILVLRLRAPSVYRLLQKLIPASAGFTLNLGDIMQVVARRR